MSLVLWLSLASCGGLYEGVASDEKRAVATFFRPDFARYDPNRPPEENTADIDVFIDVTPTNVDIVDVDFGPGITLNQTSFNIDPNGCVPDVATPSDLVGREFLRICLTLRLVGVRDAAPISFELRVDGQPVVTSSTFSILAPQATTLEP